MTAAEYAVPNVPVHELDQAASALRDADPNFAKGLIYGQLQAIGQVHGAVVDGLQEAGIEVPRPGEDISVLDGVTVPANAILSTLAEYYANVGALGQAAGIPLRRVDQ